MAFEKVARDLKEKADKKYAEANAARLSANGIDINLPHDAKVLADEYERATREESKLQAEKKAYEDAEARVNEAQSKLDKIGQEYKGLTLEEASKQVVETVTTAQLAEKKVNELKAQLLEAERGLRDKQHEKELAEKDFQSAQSHFNMVESLTQLAEAQLPDPVLQLDLENAAINVKTAREAVEQGALVRRARTELENASCLKSEASALEKKAITFRDAAHATDTVLAQSVQSLGLPLSVSGGRLIITNSDRNETKEELFSDLSKGERVDMVIDIAIKAVKKPGRRGMFIVPQEFWEGLDESHQVAIARKLEGSGVIAVTAKAVDGEGITAKVVDPFPLGG